LLKRLDVLKVPIGRKNVDVLASFRIKQTQSSDVKAGFKTPECEENV